MRVRTWDDYKQTMRAEDPIFQWAREGDLESLTKTELTAARLDAVNARGHSALMLAAYNGQRATADYLIERGAAVDSRDAGGSTVLMGATFKGDAPMVELLLARGADRRARNLKGQTALDYARAFGHAHLVEVLGATVNQTGGI